MENQKKGAVRFHDLGLSKPLLSALDKLNFVTPTPIQAQAIPLAVAGRDVIGIAQTGTGKTLSFFLPMLHRIADRKSQGLIIAPTRELAHQVKAEIDKVGSRLGYKTSLIIGGASMHRQKQDLKRKPNVIVATPGRLIDHIDQGTIRLHQVAVLVLDEADRMLDMGFAPQINRILESVPDDRQTMLFSATMPDGVSRIAQKYMRSPERVEVATPGTSAKNVEQIMLFVEKQKKYEVLKSLLNEFKTGPVIVFCRTKHKTKSLARALKTDGYKTEELHSNRSLRQRQAALASFKNGKSRVMIATDVAARGIDVKGIELVVNHDLPDTKEDYVHRIGRTGRAGRSGIAISFANPDQARDVKDIEKVIGQSIAVQSIPGTLSLEAIEKLQQAAASRSAGGRGRNRGGRGGNSRGRSGGGRRSFGGRSSGGRSGGQRSSGGNRRSGGGNRPNRSGGNRNQQRNSKK